MDDENDLHYYGTPLPEIQIDVTQAKRRIYAEDQVVKDENGRRRFHGAFTGGFSAGFWNTVGSLEGWQPQTFKSSRSEKAPEIKSRPVDYMDDEDLGEFGIAPQRILTHEDFIANKETNSQKRKLPTTGNEIIPGVPILQQLIMPLRDKAATNILKTMSWRPGQGIGTRKTKEQKKKTNMHNKREIYLMEQYGFQPNKAKTMHTNDNEEVSDDSDNEITYVPDDYSAFVVVEKSNLFGLGYSGLERSHENSKHFELFEPIEMLRKNEKKFGISGQGFGVGALEEDDENVYEPDDMSKYTFSCEDKKTSGKKETVHLKQDPHVLEGFVAAKSIAPRIPQYKINLPRDWQPRNWTERKSRFSPLDADKAEELQKSKTYDLTPQIRNQILNNDVESKEHMQNKVHKLQEKSLLERVAATANNFVTAGVIDANGEEKQKPQEKDTEKIQVQSAEKPSIGLIDNRFTFEKTLQNESIVFSKNEPKIIKKLVVVRTRHNWKPCSLLCKRYNIEDTHANMPENNDIEPRLQKPTFSIFNFNEISINTKSNFVKPVIISKPTPAPILLNKELRKSVESLPKGIVAMNLPLKKTENPSSVVKKMNRKNELEKRAEETENIPFCEKIDLFKAIFDSDNEQEEEAPTEAEKTEQKTEIGKKLLLNTSPPRGIFSALFASTKPTLTTAVPNVPVPVSVAIPEPIKEKSETDIGEKRISFIPRKGKLVQKSEVLDTKIYGPETPKIQKNNFDKIKNSEKYLVPLPNSVINDEWVEKSLDQTTQASFSHDSSDDSSEGEQLKRSRKKKKTKQKKKKDRKKKKKEKRKKVK